LNAVVFILQVFVGIKDVLTFQGWGASKIKITTALIKFNTFADGQYEEEDEAITLGFFEDKRDSIVAETVRLHTFLNKCQKNMVIDFVCY
jgi:hypothetical protein